MRLHDIRGLLLTTSLLLLPLPARAFDLRADAPAAPAGTCATNDQCGKDEFCSRLFGRCGESGKCEERPKDCTERGKVLVKPVCGCDNQSYDNACLAAISGTSVQHAGRCAP
jgi:hypothetical protein